MTDFRDGHFHQFFGVFSIFPLFKKIVLFFFLILSSTINVYCLYEHDCVIINIEDKNS